MNTKYKKDKRKSQRGFTLMEVLIAITLVVMFGSFAGVRIIASFNDAKVKGAKVQIAGFQQALQAYYLAHSKYPNTAQGLVSLIKKPSVGTIPENYPEGGYYEKKELPKDPWGNEFTYECEDYQNFTISSPGKDGTAGTEDDIKSE